MRRGKLLWLGAVLAACSAITAPARAQLQPQEPDPLARMRAAAADAKTQACTVKEPSACAEATPKIVASAQSSPTLPENLLHLGAITADPTGSAGQAQADTWVYRAFRDAGVDEVFGEDMNDFPASGDFSVSVVAEISGREKPDEFVVLGARLPSNSSPDTAASDACNAALVLEAARDIHLTGLRPLRSIRFVLFGGATLAFGGSQAYVDTHRAEMAHAIAAIIFEGGCGQVTGFSLGGRRDTEPGVREAFSVAPIDAWHIGNITYDAPWGFDNFDFLLEGVPTLLANRQDPSASQQNDPNLDTLKHNAAIAGVLAFALAEHPAPLGPRLSRAEIAPILEKTGLAAAMKMTNAWRDWQSGWRGRKP